MRIERYSLTGPSHHANVEGQGPCLAGPGLLVQLIEVEGVSLLFAVPGALLSPAVSPAGPAAEGVFVTRSCSYQPPWNGHARTLRACLQHSFGRLKRGRLCFPFGLVCVVGPAEIGISKLGNPKPTDPGSILILFRHEDNLLASCVTGLGHDCLVE